jgi:hypothetical protein
MPKIQSEYRVDVDKLIVDHHCLNFLFITHSYIKKRTVETTLIGNGLLLFPMILNGRRFSYIGWGRINWNILICSVFKVCLIFGFSVVFRRSLFLILSSFFWPLYCLQGIRIMIPSGATCLSTDCCFSKLALWKFN